MRETHAGKGTKPVRGHPTRKHGSVGGEAPPEPRGERAGEPGGRARDARDQPKPSGGRKR